MRGSGGVLCMLVMTVAFSCGESKPAAPAEPLVPASALEVRRCESNRDCPKGWVCLANACANANSQAIYSDPSNAVTPQKVQREVERINAQAQRRNEGYVQRNDAPAE